jgi:hypothetical protein
VHHAPFLAADPQIFGRSGFGIEVDMFAMGVVLFYM